MSNRITIGDRVRALRIRMDMTGVELAEKVGVSPPMISNIENGKKKPGYDTLIALA